MIKEDILQSSGEYLNGYTFLSTSYCNYRKSIGEGCIYLLNSQRTSIYYSEDSNIMNLFKSIEIKNNSLYILQYLL